MSDSESNRTLTYSDLIVWQRAMDLTDLVYSRSRTWPASETYGLTSQIRRAAVSVPANIAEGNGRNGRKEYVHHLGIARGSLFEVETMIQIGRRQAFIDDQAQHDLLACSREVARLLNGLIRSLGTPKT